MASLKAAKPCGLTAQPKVGASRAPASKQACKKGEQKPRQPKKKGKSSKTAAKN
ncbi:hypothetical protein COCNU_14G005240 [Cocos nucifera]|uniref:Uncharacterized protein n=1 Tax=Cocos nucifera TaxID=13894 RepID=A0A8K0IUR2_COCNU|nr:hypothetical protein COCNU_14G005240 [Cocos nucifera]